MRIAACVLGAAFLIAACAPRGPEASSPPPTATLGAALSLTGSAHLLGTVQRNGIRLAEDDINASHLLGNTRLDVIVEDDGSDRDQASAVMQAFIENNRVEAILGPSLSDVAQSVDPLAQQAGLPVLSISNAAGGITEIGNFIFRDCLSESQLTPAALKALGARTPIHTAALLYSDTDSNRSGSHGFKKALQDLGVQIATEQVFTSDQSDFSVQLDAIAASHPDAVFITAPSHLAGAILVQARQRGLRSVPIVGSSAFNSDAVLRAAGEAAEGVIVGSAWTAANPSQRNQQFMLSYRARFGVDPDQFAAEAYSGVYVLAAALRDASQPGDRRSLRDALDRVSGLETPLGVFEFDAERDATYPATVQLVHHGRFQLLDLP